LLSLVPCISAALLISSDQRGVANKALALLSPLGKISYSFYLLHFPALFFARKLFSLEGPLVLVAVLLGIALCSLALFYGVERPLRHVRLAGFRWALVLFVLPALLLLALSFLATSPTATAPALSFAANLQTPVFSAAEFAVGVDCRPNMKHVVICLLCWFLFFFFSLAVYGCVRGSASNAFCCFLCFCPFVFF
jgi:hypothetical protein